MNRYVFATLFGLLLAAGGVAGDQEDQAQSGEDRQKPEKEEKEALDVQGLAAIGIATVAPKCFTSGTGVTFLKVCITERGNISSFESPAGKVHLQGAREGYVVCSDLFEPQGVHGFDAGMAEEGWAAPSVSQPNGSGKLPLIITRNSTDGVVQLKQTFNIIPGEREVSITMAVKNRSASATLFDVFVDRYFDGDIDNQAANAYDDSFQSVWGLATGSGNNTNGLMLTQAPTAVAASTFSVFQPFVDWNPNGASLQLARQCLGGIQGSPGEDLVGRVSVRIATIAPGQTKSVTYRYHRI